jgi:hypothetical protein
MPIPEEDMKALSAAACRVLEERGGTGFAFFLTDENGAVTFATNLPHDVVLLILQSHVNQEHQYLGACDVPSGSN